MSIDALSPRGISPFGPQGHVSPSEQLITLTYGQLQDLIQEATERATAPLEARIQDLEARIDRLEDVTGQRHNVTGEEGVRCREGEEPWPPQIPQASQGGQGSHVLQDRIIYLEDENRGLKVALESLEELRPWLEALSKKIARLEAPRISPKTEARAEKIAKYLKERPDHRAAYETLRGHLGIDKARLNEAIKLLMATEPGRYGIARLPGDKRGRVLIMLPK